jgi:hypothetical protein
VRLVLVHVDPCRRESSLPFLLSGNNDRVSGSMRNNEAWIDTIKAHRAASS